MIKYTNVTDQSLSVAVWLVTDEYDRDPYPGKLSISATGLLKPPRMIILSDRVKAAQATNINEEAYDISMFIPNRVGTAVHSGIQNAWERNYKQALKDLGKPQAMIDRVRINPTSNELLRSPDIIPVYMELRAEKTINGYIVTGKFDFVGEGTLEDYKTTGVYGYMKSDPHDDMLKIMQGSIYRWLNPDIIISDHMLVQYIFTDWSKLDWRKQWKRGYPATKILAKKFMLKPIPETESWVRQRLALLDSLLNTPEVDLPLCTAEELWQNKPVFKYYKNPNPPYKRSTANFDNYQDAHARMLKDGAIGIVKETRANVRRCGYCGAYELCTQKDVYINNGTMQLP
jgi:hypothetical protein